MAARRESKWIARPATQALQKSKPREVLVASIFRELDTAHEGQVDAHTLWPYGKVWGFLGSAEEWLDEYAQYCIVHEWDAKACVGLHTTVRPTARPPHWLGCPEAGSQSLEFWRNFQVRSFRSPGTASDARGPLFLMRRSAGRGPGGCLASLKSDGLKSGSPPPRAKAAARSPPCAS